MFDRILSERWACLLAQTVPTCKRPDRYWAPETVLRYALSRELFEMALMHGFVQKNIAKTDVALTVSFGSLEFLDQSLESPRCSMAIQAFNPCRSDQICWVHHLSSPRYNWLFEIFQDLKTYFLESRVFQLPLLFSFCKRSHENFTLFADARTKHTIDIVQKIQMLQD